MAACTDIILVNNTTHHGTKAYPTVDAIKRKLTNMKLGVDAGKPFSQTSRLVCTFSDLFQKYYSFEKNGKAGSCEGYLRHGDGKRYHYNHFIPKQLVFLLKFPEARGGYYRRYMLALTLYNQPLPSQGIQYVIRLNLK